MKKNIPKKGLKKTVIPEKKKAVAAKSNKNFFIVGIGASAGGLEALKIFFENCSTKSGMAYVVVQHLAPTHKSLLTELIGRQTKMKVSEITDGVKIEKDHVYIIPPNKVLTIFNGCLLLKDPMENRAARRPIDLFFNSMAADLKERAIGIVLSGTGTEGTLGLKEIKSEGGFTIVQEPKTAHFAGMPQSAIDAHSADFILAPEKMPDQLLKYIHKRKENILGYTIEMTSTLENQLTKIFQIIRNQTGNDFSNYKTNTIVRRIMKRITIVQVDSLENYIVFLQKNPDEVENLYKDFLIGVTAFFRDKEVFKSIEKNVIPHLFQHCIEKQEIRIWVCGCSTGEEAYSLAILFREAQEKYKRYIKVTIFASDIDKKAIEIARVGTYAENSMADISKNLISRYFIRKTNKYQLKKEVREMVVFAHHNVLKDPPFSKMDLITCRNLFIYLNTPLQKRLFPVFHYSLNEHGIMILGTSESIGEHSESFADFDKKHKIYQKKSKFRITRLNSEYDLPFTSHKTSTQETMHEETGNKKPNISGIIEKYLLDQYTPASVIIDKNDEVIYFSGNTGQYLQPPTGVAKLNIQKMAKKGLNPALSIAIKKVRLAKKEVQTNDIEVKVNGQFSKINLIVKPIPTKESFLGALMVIFEAVESSKTIKSETTTNSAGKRENALNDIEKELKITQDSLAAANNELDILREELQSSNEEFQSSNEELQSSNEELETSREELQSVNEELITVNSELENKIGQLSQSNDDLNNLLSSIEVATVFLDRDLKIKRFTENATKIFNLIPTDIGRPVTHLSANIDYHTLSTDVKNALKTLAVKSTEVQAIDGTWYQMRIIPYRTIENIIEGVLITFVEITEIKKVQEDLKKTNEHLQLIMETLPAIPFTCYHGPELKFSFVGESSEKLTGFLPEQFINNPKFWTSRIHPSDKKAVLLAFDKISEVNSMDITFKWKCADGIYKNFINYIRYYKPEKENKAYLVGIWQEIIKPK